MEIMAAIVATTQKPSKITRTMDQLNLSYPMLRKYIVLMLKLDLIESRKISEKNYKKTQVFQATEKGFAFLKTYCDILRLLYGENFLEKSNNLAIACLKYCKESN